jgi:hypothetical protein
MTAVRVLLGAVGVVIALVGVRDLVDRGWSSLRPVLEWLIVGNVLHDGVLVPLVLVLGLVSVRYAPAWARAPVMTGFVVLGATTLVAIPVLGNYGDDPTIPSLMPRNYWLGWGVLAGLVGVAVVLGCVVNRRRNTRPPRPAGRTVGDVESFAPTDASS